MGNPTGRDIHIDSFISEMAINYRPQGHIADMVFPVVRVGKQSDAYPVWSKADWFRIPDTKRARGDQANVVELSVTSAKYYAENYAAKARVFLEDQVNSDLDWGTALGDKAMIPATKIKQDWERRVAQLCTSGSNCASYTAVASAWGTDNATPFSDIRTGIEWLTGQSGFRPNRGVMGEDAWFVLQRSQEMRDLIFPHGGGVPTVQQVAAILELDELLIGRGYYNSGAEGQSISLASIWGPNFLLYYAPSVPQKDEPSFGYTFRWAEGGLPELQAEIHPYDSKTHSQEVEVGFYQDEVITASDLGYLFIAVDSSTGS